jgi:hypothetical protein
MSVDEPAFDEISALCRTALSSREIYALDQAIAAELMRELGRLRRASVTADPPVPSASPVSQVPNRQSNGKLKLAGA